MDAVVFNCNYYYYLQLKSEVFASSLKDMKEEKKIYEKKKEELNSGIKQKDLKLIQNKSKSIQFCGKLQH